ncbi:MAG: PAS domain S-box protein [bacterium]|nr:PAS domain S-box protein [bacterium]
MYTTAHIASSTFPNRLSTIENNMIRQVTEHAVLNINKELKFLERTSLDWSRWEDTYNFIHGIDKNEYIKENLSKESLGHINVDCILFLDADNIVLYKKLLLPSSTELQAAVSKLEKISKDWAKPATSSATVSGILPANNLYFFAISTNITNGASSEKSAGRVVLIRKLSETYVAKLSENPLSSKISIEDQNASVNYVEISSTHIIIRKNLKHLENKQLFLVSNTPRSIYKIGKIAETHFRVTIALMGVFLAAIAVYISKILVISRVNSTIRYLQQAPGILPKNIDEPSKEKDELSIIEKTIHDLFRELYNAKKELELIVKNQADRLSQSEEMYKQLVCTIPDTIIVHKNLKILFINRAGMEIADKYGATNIIGESVLSFIQEDKKEEILKRIESGAVFGSPHRTIISAPKLAGSDKAVNIEVESISTPITYNNEKAILTVLRDMTEWRKNLNLSTKLQKAVECLPIGITITDLDGKITYANNTDVKMHGYSSDKDLIGNYAMETYDHGERRYDYSGVTEWRGLIRESTNKRRDGTEFPVRLMSEVVHSKEGEPVAIITTCEDITEKKETERNLHMLEKAVETTDVGITISDENRKIIYVNEADAALHGYQREELLGRYSNIYAVLNTKQQPIGVKKEDYKYWKRISRNVRKNGEPFPVELVSNPIYNNNSSLAGVVTVCTSIEDRVAAEMEKERLNKASKDSEERMRKAILNSPFPIMMCSESGEVLLLSQTWTDITGYSSFETPTIYRWLSVSCPNYNEESANSFTRKLFRSRIGKIHNGELLIETRESMQRIWDIYSSIIGYLPDGKRIFMIAATDITDQKHYQNRLSYKRDLLRTLVDTIPDQIYVQDSNQRLSVANKAFLDFTGETDYNAIIGKTCLDISIGEFGSEFTKEDTDILKTGIPIFNQERLLVRYDNTKIWVLLSKVPIKNQDDCIIGIVCIRHEITDYKELQEEHKMLKEAYKFIAQQTTQFLHGVNNEYEQ